MESNFKKILDRNYEMKFIEKILKRHKFPKSGNKDKLLEIILNNATIFEYFINKLLNESYQDKIKEICNELDIDSNSKVDELKKKILDKLNKTIKNKTIKNKIKFLDFGFYAYNFEPILKRHKFPKSGNKDKLLEQVARNDFLVETAMTKWKNGIDKDSIQGMCGILGIDSKGKKEELLQKISDCVLKNETKKDVQNEIIVNKVTPTINKTNSTKHSGKISEEDLENDFKKYDPFEMERIVGNLFESKGYKIKVTPSTGDFGVDVWATNDNEKIAIQVKHQEKDVGYDAIAKTIGATLAQVNRVIVISTKSGFTKQTMEYQMEHQSFVHLWNTTKFKNQLREYLI